MEQQHIFSVSELNQLTREILEKTFNNISVHGEISNISRPASGHMYFSLKDARSQIRCAFFAGYQHSLNFKPINGEKVTVRAQVSLYPERGDYQLIVRHMIKDGLGDLQLKYEQLKQKLKAEGLFDNAHKKIIPRFPKKIGIITSDTGAALHDVISVLQRRFAIIPFVLYPSQVQGDAAAGQLIAAINKANADNDCDVLILTRGGGSLEDLWAFNDEQLARAIYRSNIPIISAIGHEVDFTIAEFVADRRAPTPSAAAELASPDGEQVYNLLQNYKIRMMNRLVDRLNYNKQMVDQLSKRLVNPAQKLQLLEQHLDYITVRLQQVIHSYINSYNNRINMLAEKLNRMNPEGIIETNYYQLNLMKQRLIQAYKKQLNHKEKSLAIFCDKLQVLSPLQTLSRGYSIVYNSCEKIIDDAAKCALEESINLTLARGKLECKVTKILP